MPYIIVIIVMVIIIIIIIIISTALEVSVLCFSSSTRSQYVIQSCHFIYSLKDTLYLLLTVIYSLQNNFIVFQNSYL